MRGGGLRPEGRGGREGGGGQDGERGRNSGQRGHASIRQTPHGSFRLMLCRNHHVPRIKSTWRAAVELGMSQGQRQSPQVPPWAPRSQSPEQPGASCVSDQNNLQGHAPCPQPCPALGPPKAACQPSTGCPEPQAETCLASPGGRWQRLHHFFLSEYGIILMFLGAGPS